MADPSTPLQGPVPIGPANAYALLESAPDAVFVADIEGRVSYVNAAACAMLGYGGDEIIGRTLFDFVPEDDVPRLLQARAAMLDGRSRAAEWLLRRKDGSWLPVEVNANILPAGQWQGFVRDISPRKAEQAERDALFEKMERDRRWLHLVMDQMPLGVTLIEPDGKLVFNERAAQLLGIGRSPAGGGSEQYASRVFHPDGRPVSSEELPSARVLRGETVIGAEFVIHGQDGKEIPVLGSAGPIVDGDGHLMGGVSVFQDMSERLGLERAIRENERLLAAVFDLLPVGLWIADRDGNIVLGNPAGDRIWSGVHHLGADQLNHYEGWWVDTGLPIAPDEWGIARAVRRGETSRSELIRIKCFDGSFKTIINWAAPIRGEAGEITGAVAVNEDVTALHQTQEQLRAAVRDREHILAVVAHDLRNPLNAIMLRAALAEQQARKVVGAEALGASAASIGQISRTMSGLVDDLLAISSARSGRSMLNFMPIPPAAVVAKAAETAQPLLARAGLQLVVGPLGDLPLVHIDQNRILRVFSNLLDNALKFTARGGRIEVRAEAAQGAVKFSVANSGPALREEEMERLFQPFWQAGHEDRRGTGLGLSICRSIVEAHGGSIWAEPSAGMRVKVCFLLPSVKPAAPGPVAGAPG